MKNRIAPHVAELPKSGIRKFFDIVAQSKDVVSLGVGEPDFDTPWHISRAAVTCLENGGTHYTSNLGTPAVRQAICRYLERRFGAKFDWTKETLVTVGVSEAIDLAVRALCSPGDEVLYHEPCFVSYAATIRLAHAVPVPVETRVEDSFRLTVDALEKKVSPRTKALLLNFPCNPTGATLDSAQMKEILDFCERHDIILLADEVYSELNYEIEEGSDELLPSFSSWPQFRDRVVLLNGFSKSWAMTGYRLGYACGPEDIIDAMMKIHQYGIMSAPTLAQAAGVEAMDFGDKDVAKMRREYRKRRDYLVPALNDMGLPTLMPKGAFYLFPDIRPTGVSSEDFCMKLLKEYKVACVPGGAFGKCGEGFIRISYATSLEKIKIAAANIARMVRSFGAAAVVASALVFAGCSGSPTYEATARFAFDVNRLAPSGGAASTSLQSSYSEILAERMFDWRSEEVAAKTLAAYRAAQPGSTLPDEEVLAVLATVDIRPVAGSRIIEVTARSDKMYVASSVLNSYLESISGYTDEMNARRSKAATATLHANVEKKRRDVDRLAKQFLDFKTDNPVQGMKEHAAEVAKTIRKTSDEIASAEREAADLKSRLAAVEAILETPERIGEFSGELLKTPLLAGDVKAYAASMTARDRLLSMYTENHPEVIAKKREVEETARRLVAALRRTREITMAALSVKDGSLSALRRRYDEVRAELQSIDRKIVLAESGLAQLQAEMDVSNNVLTEMILEENKAQINADSNNEAIRIVNRAREQRRDSGLLSLVFKGKAGN